MASATKPKSNKNSNLSADVPTIDHSWLMPSDRRNKAETKAAQDLKDNTRKALNLFYEKVVIIDAKHKAWKDAQATANALGKEYAEYVKMTLNSLESFITNTWRTPPWINRTI